MQTALKVGVTTSLQEGKRRRGPVALPISLPHWGAVNTRMCKGSPFDKEPVLTVASVAIGGRQSALALRCAEKKDLLKMRWSGFL